ncbi:hypothetical protein [Actinophytocola sp.]|uniref:hypothetical protein n=1 Tax=Actinophytocola sp. TaxID=1872138 RepID=UPI002D75FA98|nr:hypothetical protein [Actinophytocola sp.]HYQ62665.1 hypothetical protein [Actinophytocola sp.]
MTEVPVARLTRRLADTPPDFLAEDAVVAAVVGDLLLMAGGSALRADEAVRFESGTPNWRRTVLVTCWLLADPALLARGPMVLSAWLTAPDLVTLSALVDPLKFVRDPDRREELARVTMRALALAPAAETPEQATDRLSTVDSARRHEVLLAAKVAEERAATVRKAMEEQRAREAAARYSQV